MLKLALLLHILRAYTLPILQTVEPPDLAGLVAQFATLAGVAGLVAILINVGKAAGVVKDGQAPTFSLVLNVIGFVALAALRLFWPEVDIAGLDQVASTVAQILALVLGLWFQFGSAKIANNAVKGLPVIGFSHSRRLEQAQPRPYGR